MKVTDIFFSLSKLFVSFVDGEKEGQILWHGEILTESFGVFPFSAEQISPVTWEQVLHPPRIKNFQVIRKLEKSEYPALKQAIQEYLATNLVFEKKLEVDF